MPGLGVPGRVGGPLAGRRNSLAGKWRDSPAMWVITGPVRTTQLAFEVVDAEPVIWIGPDLDGFEACITC